VRGRAAVAAGQPRPPGSIQRRLLLWGMGTLTAGAALLVGGSYLLLADEMDEIFADNLKQVALAVANHHGGYGSDREARLAQQLPLVYDENGKFEFVTVVWTPEGQRVHSSDDSVAVPFLRRSGLSRVRMGGEDWHVYTVVLEDGVMQAAQRESDREALSRETASKLVLPTLVMLLLLAVLLALALRRGMAPLARAAGEVSSVEVETLRPIPLERHPLELQPLVSEINQLMTRLGKALSLQREFLADAAHELRTPVTALRLQLQLLERADSDAARSQALEELRAGIDRLQHLVQQLLQVARVAPDAPALRLEPVDLGALARGIVARFSTRAEERGIDLGADAEQAPRVRGDVHQLEVLLENLVDNALRHTPRGGRIDVAAGDCEGLPCLRVTDSGPGIPALERERVFARFYRAGTVVADASSTPGSGLGLAIARAVAERHGGSIALDDAPSGRGLQVTVSFPPPR
jgi:signal transduction histidine kinase